MNYVGKMYYESLRRNCNRRGGVHLLGNQSTVPFAIPQASLFEIGCHPLWPGLTVDTCLTRVLM